MAIIRDLRICNRLAMYPTVAYSAIEINTRVNSCLYVYVIRIHLLVSRSRYSPNNEAKTITKQVPRYTSIDFTYDIFGNAALVEDIKVVMVSTVVTPSDTLAGVALRFSQKLTHEMITIKPEGI